LIPEPKLADFETEQIFKELEQFNTKSIPKKNFLNWFGQDEQEKQFQYGIEDVLKPLATYLERNKLTIGKLFEKYDQNKNQMMSAAELASAVK
jgi:5-formaminoimidazole-4-carboxamide-1-beta-D-ribofuranosyl 5'-monophosphate synthetase